MTAGPRRAPFTPRPARMVRVSSETLVRERYVDEVERFPLVIEPTDAATFDVVAWASGHRDELSARLVEHGAILFRGFPVDSPEQFGELARGIAPDLLDYQERAAPRSRVSGKVFTSTEFAADQDIPLHHEMSYSHNWPCKVFLYCDLPAESGGRTPIAAERKTFPQIPPEVAQPFIDRKVMYVRNYSAGLDLPWQDAFQTDDRADVEAYCRRWGIAFEWLGEDRLRTRQVRQAVATHPVTGETVWFNHAHLFHISNVAPDVADAMISQLGMDGLPRNALYGDGSPIPVEALDVIRRVYRDNAIAFDWHKGDVMMLDNFLTTHGREPYRGERRTLVAMAELYVNPDLRERAQP